MTLMVGEKHVPLGQWGVGWWDCSMYNGDYPSCSARPAGVDFPLAQSPRDLGMTFGSYHTGVCQFAFADGHVQALANSISPRTLGQLAGRDDGEVVGEF
jgi:prepilin-type processing-associated H-X9-DG protein